METVREVSGSPLRVLMALPGLHRVIRGAEVAFESIATELARDGKCEVTLVGSGDPIEGRPYRFLSASCTPRERFEWAPRLPVLRDAYCYEELSFAPGLWRAYDPADYDITVTCSYPFTNWLLRSRKHRGQRPAHVYVTQNGDWPAWSSGSEFRYFGCEGLVCTNPEYYARNADRWNTALIPNGVDDRLFHPVDEAERARIRGELGLPLDAPVVLMVSAFIPSKRVLEGIRCAARLPDVHVISAGDGPLRDEVARQGHEALGERFRCVRVPRAEMPDLYRAADCFLHMSMDEPSANAYIEALATGLPIVTHDRDVTRWTLEETGVLVDTTDDDTVLAALERMLSLRTPAHVAARRELVARRFTWKHLASQYESFFRAVLRERG